MDALQRPVVVPTVEIIMDRAARRKVLWDVAPSAPCAKDVHDTIDNFPRIHRPFVAASFGWGYQRRGQRPFFVHQVMGIAHALAIMPATGLWGPDDAPREVVPCKGLTLDSSRSPPSLKVLTSFFV
jgi:hypothetical protein